MSANKITGVEKGISLLYNIAFSKLTLFIPNEITIFALEFAVN